jgi:predicted CoA-binding protein
MAVLRLLSQGHSVWAVGKRTGVIGSAPISSQLPNDIEIDTVTLYLNAEHQKMWYHGILHLHPRRIIFNPGAENAEFFEMARNQGIECTEACTLVLLSTGSY